MRVILAGGRTEEERRMGVAIESAAKTPIVNQIAKDTLPELLGLLAKSTVLVSPDSGPAHMATMVGTPVIGLYAATRTARAGPYYSRPWCVDKYDEASRMVYGKSADAIPWTTKIERPGVMDLIATDEVTGKLDALMAQRK
jgi:heptosyltransferase I